MGDDPQSLGLLGCKLGRHLRGVVTGTVIDEEDLAVDTALRDVAQRLGPVSYTHLDVYKRQPMRRSAVTAP